MKKIISALFLVITFIVVGFFLVNSSSEANPSAQGEQGDNSRGIPVRTVKVEKKDIASTLEYTGTISADYSVQVSAATAGILKKNFVEEGDVVHKGQILAVIDREKLQAKIDLVRQKLSSAEINLSYWQQQLEKFQFLYDEGAISKQKYEEVLYKKETAESQLKEVEASLHEAYLALEDTQIIAPAGGTVEIITAHEGDFVNPGKPVFTIIPEGDFKVQVKVVEDDLKHVKPGTKALLRVSEKVMTSSVEKILPSLSKVAKTATIEIPFPEKNTADIYVGQSVQVSIVLGEKKAVPVVPLEALKEEQGKNYIFVIKDNKALRREVKTGLSNGHQVEIIEGLTKGEEIIITRSMEVRDGSKVIVYNRGV